MSDLPISEFIVARLKEFDSTFELRPKTAFYDLFVRPQQFMLQPFQDDVSNMKTGTSLRKILSLADPDAYDEDIVDDLCSNVYVTRVTGSGSAGVARIYFISPVTREYPVGGVRCQGSNGVVYQNSSPFLITENQMASQIEDGLFYADIAISSETAGSESELDPGNLVEVLNDSLVTSVTNKTKISGGVSRETNTQLLKRAKNSIGVRDLNIGKGLNGILYENFASQIQSLTPIGFGDKEMMRDIVYNTHIGGKVDVYVKTPSITLKEQDFAGVLIDSTRQSSTTTQFEINGTSPFPLGEANVDRILRQPIVTEVKASEAAFLKATVDISGGVDLSSGTNLNITIDNATRNVRVAGATPSSTLRSDVIRTINQAFGRVVAKVAGQGFSIGSLAPGRSSVVRVTAPPTPSTNAVPLLFGPLAAYESLGDGPAVFSEGAHYTIDDGNGTISRSDTFNSSRINSTSLVPPGSGGVGEITIFGSVISPSATAVINSVTLDSKFASVELDDVFVIQTGTHAGEYRVIRKIDNNTVVLDKLFTAQVELAVVGFTTYLDGGMKSSEFINIEFDFNPLSIDIGKLVSLDAYGAVRGLRPGRENLTITGIPFLRILKIELIDGVSGEPLGVELGSRGGFGLGGFGEGVFGVGSGQEFRVVINKTAERFSMFEDAYIVINNSYEGSSFRVTYECVPELGNLHNFCRSDSERVLDGDVLIKHYLPGYVSGQINYSVDKTDISVPSNEALTERVRKFISTRPTVEPLNVSDVTQYLLSQIDPNFKYKSSVAPVTLTVEIHNTDGTVTVVSDRDKLVVPTPDPFPRDTAAPISEKIVHWVGDNIILVRD
jgi:hypothetical protein